MTHKELRTIRNIGIMAHVDAGKTTLTERILLNAGRIHRAGDVHTGSTQTDSGALEKKHGITISAAATSCDWNGAAITIVDTPGHVEKGTPLINPRTGERERVGRIVVMHADEQTEVNRASAGDVVAVIGLKSVLAGDTLADLKAPILLTGLECPEPVIEAVVEARDASEQDRLSRALADMAREDPSLRVSSDPETGQVLVAAWASCIFRFVWRRWPRPTALMRNSVSRAWLTARR